MKNKKSKKFASTILIIFALIAILLGSGALPMSSVGITVMSLSNIDLQSSFSPLDGQQVFAVTARLAGLSQYIQGLTIDSNDISSYTDKFTKHDFEIDVENIEQECVYDLYADSNMLPIIKFNYNTWYCISAPSYSTARSKCPSGYLAAAGKFSTSLTCACVEGTPVGIVGNIDSLPDVDSKFDIVVRSQGTEERKSFSTLSGSTQGRVGSNTYAIWQGNLDTGRACDGTQGRIATYYQGTWRITSSSAYDSYKTKVTLNNLENTGTVIGAGWSSSSSMISEINEVNTRADAALTPQQFGTFRNPTSINSGTIVKSLANSLSQNPVITLYVKAAWLGIYTPVPEPIIVGVDSYCFKTGEDGNVDVTVKNVGSERGGVDITLTCPSPFTSRTEQITLNAGEQRTVSIPLRATTSTHIDSSCTVKVSSVASSDSDSVDVCVDPQKVCTPNARVCLDDKVQKCNSDGSAYDVIDSCKYGCTYKSGVAVCETNDDDDDDNGGFDFIQWIKNLFAPLIGLFGGALDLLKILGILFGVVGFGAGAWFTGKTLSERKVNKAVAIITALIVGLLIALLAMSYWWVALLIIVAFFAIKFVLGRLV